MIPTKSSLMDKTKSPLITEKKISKLKKGIKSTTSKTISRKAGKPVKKKSKIIYKV